MAVSASQPAEGPLTRPVYAFEAPVRLYHWVNAACILVLAATGYLIAHPLPSVVGEASSHFLMGRIRMIHFTAGYLFAVSLAGRIYWALVGNRVARQIFVVPVWRPAWWRELGHEIAFYLFLRRDPPAPVGHGALAQAAMFLFNTLASLYMIATGFALYGEGLGHGSWADRAFGWVIPAMGDAERVHNWHNLGMWLILCFVIIHIYMAVRADIAGRTTSVSAILGGWRSPKGGR
ncbi:MAG: Ni/Fe-hydrogenase, b-type cytochrome subunit [Nitrospirae bacterium]|nr:MAG: Ni/Fe-hydrogenase, b-type cytochrome subunit [Nitrospirota bacterium]